MSEKEVRCSGYTHYFPYPRQGCECGQLTEPRIIDTRSQEYRDQLIIDRLDRVILELSRIVRGL